MSGDRSKGHDLLFSADYADYADYCMRVAWAMRTTAGMQEVEPRRSSCRGAASLWIAQHQVKNGSYQFHMGFKTTTKPEPGLFK